MKKNDPSQYYQSYLYIGYSWAIIVLIMLFLTSCTIYESTYTTTKHTCELMERGEQCLSDHRCCETQEHSTQIYYYNDLPYWGFYSGYYYYYGVPHYYPWWYYYTLRPHYTYSVHTHITIFCDNGYYVSKPRGPKFNNNRGGVYKPTKVIVKPNRSNRTNIKTVPNKNRSNIKINTNKTNIKINTNKNSINKNRSNIKINTNKNNIKINTNKNRSNVKINRNISNKSNNRTFNNKKTNIRTNTRKPR